MCKRSFFFLLVVSLLSFTIACDDDDDPQFVVTPGSNSDTNSSQQDSPTPVTSLTPLQVAGLWADDQEENITLNNIQWGNSLSVVTFDNDQSFAVVSEDLTSTTPSYKRLDWALDGNDLYYCISSEERSTIEEAKAVNRPNASDKQATGCGTLSNTPWKKLTKAFKLSGQWIVPSDYLYRKVSTKKFGDLEVEAFDNTKNRAILKKGTEFVRLVWVDKQEGGFYACQEGDFSTTKPSLDDPVDTTKVDPKKLDSGCLGRPWVVYQPRFELAFPNGNWKLGSENISVSYTSFRGEKVVEHDYDSGLFVVKKAENNYSLVAYKKNSWKDASFCVVNKEQPDVVSARFRDLDKVDAQNEKSGCHGKSWETLTQPFAIEGKWEAPQLDVVFDISGYWFADEKIIFHDPQTKTLITHKIVYDASSAPHSYYRKLVAFEKNDLLYVCPLTPPYDSSNPSDSSMKDAFGKNLDSVSASDLNAGCVGSAWQVARKPNRYRGTYYDQNNKKYYINSTHISVDSDTLGIVKSLDEHTFIVKSNPGGTFSKYHFTRVESFPYSIFMCISARDKANLDVVETDASLVDPSNLTLGCGGNDPWVELKGINLQGMWSTPWGDAQISAEAWNQRRIKSFSYHPGAPLPANTSVAIVYSPYSTVPGYSRMIWTDIVLEDGKRVTHYCEDVSGKLTPGEAMNASPVAADPSNLTGGCGGFAWTKYSQSK